MFLRLALLLAALPLATPSPVAVNHYHQASPVYKANKIAFFTNADCKADKQSEASIVTCQSSAAHLANDDEPEPQVKSLTCSTGSFKSIFVPQALVDNTEKMTIVGAEEGPKSCSSHPFDTFGKIKKSSFVKLPDLESLSPGCHAFEFGSYGQQISLQCFRSAKETDVPDKDVDSHIAQHDPRANGTNTQDPKKSDDLPLELVPSHQRKHRKHHNHRSKDLTTAFVFELGMDETNIGSKVERRDTPKLPEQPPAHGDDTKDSSHRMPYPIEGPPGIGPGNQKSQQTPGGLTSGFVFEGVGRNPTMDKAGNKPSKGGNTLPKEP